MDSDGSGVRSSQPPRGSHARGTQMPNDNDNDKSRPFGALSNLVTLPRPGIQGVKLHFPLLAPAVAATSGPPRPLLLTRSSM